jgi:hypothetical protein
MTSKLEDYLFPGDDTFSTTGEEIFQKKLQLEQKLKTIRMKKQNI